MLGAINYHLVAALGGKSEKPTPLARPGVEPADDGARHVGQAIPLQELLKRLPGIEGEKVNGATDGG
jgi:hypothetical protein